MVLVPHAHLHIKHDRPFCGLPTCWRRARRTPGSGGCGLPRWVARACARRLCVPAPFGYQLRTWAGTRTGEPSGPQVPSGRFSHATARLRPRSRPEADCRAEAGRAWSPLGTAAGGSANPRTAPVAARVLSGWREAAAWCTIGWGCEVGGGRSSVPVDRASPADLMQLATDVGPAPMHVGAVLVLGTGPGFSVQDAQRLLGERVHAVPRLRQRLRRRRRAAAGRSGSTTRRLTSATTSGRCPARHPATSGHCWRWPRP